MTAMHSSGRRAPTGCMLLKSGASQSSHRSCPVARAMRDRSGRWPVWAGGGIHHLPGLRRARVRILGEQVVEQRAPRAREPDDEHGPRRCARRRCRDAAARSRSSCSRVIRSRVRSPRATIRPSSVRAASLSRHFSRRRNGSRKPSSPKSSRPVARRAAPSKLSSSSETGRIPARPSTEPTAFVARTPARTSVDFIVSSALLARGVKSSLAHGPYSRTTPRPE